MAKVSMMRTIGSAREYLKSGNGGAYARLLSAAIRAASDDRAAKVMRQAIAEDGTSFLFQNLDTDCPTAA